MNRPTIIYLAGPMDFVSKECSEGWRNDVTIHFQSYIEQGLVTLLNPCRRPHGCDLTPREVYKLDIMDVKECDMILADIRYSPRENTGTSCEMFYCHEILKKPVIGWLTEDTKPPRERLFMSQIVDREFMSLEAALEHIEEYYILKR